MTTPVAGWYADPQEPDSGVDWYWDGTQWTEQRRPTTSGMTTAMPAQANPTGPVPTGARRGLIKKVSIGLLIFGLGGALGVAAGSSDAADQKKRADLAVKASAESAAEAAASGARADAAEAAAKQADAKAQAGVVSQLAAVNAEKAKLAAREKAVGIAEAEAAANTIPGEGTFLVGSEIRPGTYKSDGPSGDRSCYWARRSKSEDILSNDLTDGPTILVVRASDFSVEISGCQDFRKVG